MSFPTELLQYLIQFYLKIRFKFLDSSSAVPGTLWWILLGFATSQETHLSHILLSGWDSVWFGISCKIVVLKYNVFYDDNRLCLSIFRETGLWNPLREIIKLMRSPANHQFTCWLPLPRGCHISWKDSFCEKYLIESYTSYFIYVIVRYSAFWKKKLFGA